MKASFEEAKAILADMNAASETLGKDIDVLNAYMATRENIEFWFRTGIRNFFADLEARSFLMRRFCLALHKFEIADFTEEEIIGLRDETVRIDKGEVVLKPAKTRTSDALLFAFAMFQKAIKHPDKFIDSGSHEWGELVQCVRIRDRVTHPKLNADLTLTNDELDSVSRSMTWIEEKFETAWTAAPGVIEKLKEQGKL